MNKRLLAVFAHPDDESFGPGGTLAKYAKEGVEIHVLCATRGEAGKDSRRIRGKRGISGIRENELSEAAKVLGVKKVEFLNFIDGELGNKNYHELAEKIKVKIVEYKPQVILTFEPRGVSGHLDHVALCFVTTFVFLQQKIAKKLYYYCVTAERSKLMKDYFIYFPAGYDYKDISTTINVSEVWETKVRAMKKHRSQLHDVERILTRFKDFPHEENFVLFRDYHEKFLKEKDFFESIE